MSCIGKRFLGTTIDTVPAAHATELRNFAALFSRTFYIDGHGTSRVAPTALDTVCLIGVNSLAGNFAN